VEALITEAAATHLLIDEATLKAGNGDAMETIRKLAAIVPAGATAVLWTAPDAGARSQLLAAGIGNIIEKPISGAALIAAIVPEPQENLAVPGGERLVSQAA
jgi:DNA-binding NarL/FixJ family response regulator